MPLTRLEIHVRGIVQGVGFRPFVYNLAQTLSLTGYIFNSSAGVTIEVEGSHRVVQEFLEELRNHPPQLAELTEITTAEVTPRGDTVFSILPSQQQAGEFVLVSPDAGTCVD